MNKQPHNSAIVTINYCFMQPQAGKHILKHSDRRKQIQQYCEIMLRLERLLRGSTYPRKTLVLEQVCRVVHLQRDFKCYWQDLAKCVKE